MLIRVQPNHVDRNPHWYDNQGEIWYTVEGTGVQCANLYQYPQGTVKMEVPELTKEYRQSVMNRKTK